VSQRYMPAPGLGHVYLQYPSQARPDAPAWKPPHANTVFARLARPPNYLQYPSQARPDAQAAVCTAVCGPARGERPQTVAVRARLSPGAGMGTVPRRCHAAFPVLDTRRRCYGLTTVHNRARNLAVWSVGFSPWHGARPGSRPGWCNMRRWPTSRSGVGFLRLLVRVGQSGVWRGRLARAVASKLPWREPDGAFLYCTPNQDHRSAPLPVHDGGRWVYRSGPHQGRLKQR